VSVYQIALFFNDKMKGMPQAAKSMKNRYCLSDNSGCARYMVFKKLGREKVPIDLFPGQVDRAKDLIA